MKDCKAALKEVNLANKYSTEKNEKVIETAAGLFSPFLRAADQAQDAK